MEEKILAKVEELSGQLIDTIVRMVQIDSVEAEAEPDAPFGRGVKRALDAALELSGQLGFDTVNVDNYMGYASRERFYTLMNDYVLNAKNNGERFHIDFRDEEFGQVEVRNFKILPEKGQGDGSAASVPSLQFAVSYPAGCTAAQILETVRGELPDMEAELISNMDPVRFEKDCRLVDTLRYTYERVTGMDGTPVTTTGGTYAKRMPNIVPFGPSFPGQKGIGHQPDEWMKVDDIVANAKIYALSLYYLAKDVEMERK